MAKETMLWNTTLTASVRATKIRSFAIYEGRWLGDPVNNGYRICGWFNKDEAFEFGSFKTKLEAELFLSDIHDKILI